MIFEPIERSQLNNSASVMQIFSCLYTETSELVGGGGGGQKVPFRILNRHFFLVVFNTIDLALDSVIANVLLRSCNSLKCQLAV